MGQFGMSMPGQQVQRRPSVNVYTGLLALAVVCLVGAAGFVGLQARKISPDGGMFSLQKDPVKEQTSDIQFQR